MNVDVPELIKSMVPGDSEGRTARIISDRNVNYRDHHFLASDFPRAAPKIYLTAEDDDFDPETLADWRNEGFDVEYFPMGNDTEAYNRALRDLSKVERGPCETFGIVAFGDAATLCLEHYHIWDNNPGFQLAFLIAYYPSSIPHPEGRFPSSLNVLVHLIAGEPINITQRSQMHGMKGKLTVSRGTVDSGIGTGGLLNMAYSSYAYHAKAGFSEHDLEEYDRVAADLAWSRSLASARQAFNRHENLELAVEHSLRGKFWSRNLTATMDSFTTRENPHVTYLPTLTGGIGEDELEKFYADFFGTPPSLRLTLLSRTIGATRVVDEIHVRFKHTHEMPWILPSVPPTNKRVQVLVVSIVTMKGGKICHEHVYWDQASVLIQVGLLDPKLLTEEARNLGVEKLPVVGKEAASRVLRGWDPEEEGEADNALISDWEHIEKDDETVQETEKGKGKEREVEKETEKEGGVKREKGGRDEKVKAEGNADASGNTRNIVTDMKRKDEKAA